MADTGSQACNLVAICLARRHSVQCYSDLGTLRTAWCITGWRCRGRRDQAACEETIVFVALQTANRAWRGWTGRQIARAQTRRTVFQGIAGAVGARGMHARGLVREDVRLV